MKLIFAVIQNDDERELLGKLTGEGFWATKLASTGGFLRTGNTTLMLGVEDDRVGDVVKILRDTCKARTVTMPAYPYAMESGLPTSFPVETRVGGATIFIMPMEQQLHL